MTNVITTADIINEFKSLIDEDRNYDLKELKQILTDIYKTKTNKVKIIKEKKVAIKVDDNTDTDKDDEDIKPKKKGRPVVIKLKKNGEPRAKRAPTAYNIFMGIRIKELKVENKENKANDNMKLVAEEWKLLSQEQKDTYKPVKIETDEEMDVVDGVDVNSE
jgi:hypothetical protein